MRRCGSGAGLRSGRWRDKTRLFMCHDYGTPQRKTIAWQTSVAEQRAENIHVNSSVKKEQFVLRRNNKDATLDLPRLIIPSIQINIRAGQFPPVEENGLCYLKIPLNGFPE